MQPSRDDVVGLLGTSQLFTGIDPEELRRIAGKLDEQHYLADRRILTEGMSGVEFFLVLEGSAAVESGGATVATLGPGDFFGEVAALDHGPRTATVRATTELRCLTLPNGALMGLLLEHPRFALNMLHASVRRFKAAMTSAPFATAEGGA
jgi:CRP/FNR family transcriptional regulator, cyclic AMP receptor protein